ncbi:hypothetical protein J2Z69_001050 [Paenibacillus shirakamiensis]|uniref:Sialate O-acetylesterase domain-containing protein n=1 Tax=Paenibacillus shirakamiensis TaxID=1265935 RepID=A0ABS4JE86_9BACL|nr:sialate O-acetylesterase [Paenibacillus shirakamiensis]MBP2000031.1 hypothetical protein [Paenibacillus shirakamiensis]
MKSILLIGQSNMAGRGFIADVEPIYNEHIHMLRNGRWQMMAEPLHSDRQIAGIGPAASFAQAWTEDHPGESIGLIPCAEGGSSIDEWDIEGVLVRHAISEVSFARETSELIGILWHQGESDSYGDRYKTYENKLILLCRHLRNVFNRPDLPIMIGELGSYLGKRGWGKHAVQFKEINRILSQVAHTEHNCYYVSSTDLTANPDGIHLDALSLRRFGLRYYEAFSKQQHVLDRLDGEEEWIEKRSIRTLSKNEYIYIQNTKLALGELSYDEYMSKIAELGL